MRNPCIALSSLFLGLASCAGTDNTTAAEPMWGPGHGPCSGIEADFIDADEPTAVAAADAAPPAPTSAGYRMEREALAQWNDPAYQRRYADSYRPSEEPEGLPLSISRLDRAPRAIHQPSPIVPEDLRDSAPATVHVLFVVDRDGEVEQARVGKTTDPRFAASALAAVNQWLFEPGTWNGQPVRFRMRVAVTFPRV